MEYVEKLEKCPNDLFSNSFEEMIDNIKELFKNHQEYLNKPIVKLCVLGNVSSGKSTLINSMLEMDILYEGIPEGTLCAAKCQSISNNDEYFRLYDGNFCLDQKMSISFIKNINCSNPTYSKFSMNTNNYLDIYLNISKHEILEKLLLIDCPGFNADNLDAISKYCDYADIIIFCFTADKGVTDRDIDKIKKIKSKMGNLQISCIINCCDKCDSIDKDGIIDKLSPHLTEEDAIFFISALEERKKMFNDERHRQFGRFKKCLQKQKSQATITYNVVYLELICSIKKLVDCLRFTKFRDYRFSDKAFTELQQQTQRLINDNKTKYCRDECDKAFADYSDIADNAISDFIMKKFIHDYNLNERIIDENYFYQLLIDRDITEPTFSWYEFGDKSEKIKRCFLQHFNVQLRNIKSDIEKFYGERTQTCLNELRTYKNELNIIIDNINKLVFQV